MMWMLFRLLLRVLGWLFAARVIRAARGQRRAPSEGYLGGWLVLILFAAIFGLLVTAGAWYFLPPFLVCVVLAMPWTVARWILIPLGMSRAAGWFSSIAGWAWYQDCRGGGLVAAAWAICRQHTPSRADMDRVEAGLASQQPMLTAAQVLAYGLLAAARGDYPTARTLLESVDELGVQTTPPLVHELAREWLVVDAVERGQWAQAARLAAGERPRTRLTRFLAAAAARMARQPDAPSVVQLWAHWLLAPGRRYTYALAQQAASVVVSQNSAPAEPLLLGTSLHPDVHVDALAAHVAALVETELRTTDLERLASLWDDALAAPETRAFLLRRAAILGARGGEQALLALSDAVAQDLANMARAAGLPLAERAGQSRILAEAQRWLHNQLLSELELAFEALSQRVDGKHALSPMEEWREWLSLRTLHRRAASLGGMELRRLAFPNVHQVACKLAVWLWNERREYLISNAIFRWLLDEAMAVGDAQAIELQNRNWDKKL